MNTIKRVALLAVLSVAALSFAVPSALATYYLHHPHDPSYAYVRNHHWIYVCDQQRDGHKSYVQYRLGAPSSDHDPYKTGYDSYGYYNGQWCHYEGTSLGTPIWKWVICVQYEGCSGFGPDYPRPKAREVFDLGF